MIWRRRFDRIQINRKQYRIEYNWNTFTSFMEAEGMTFGQLDQLEKLNPAQFITMMYEALKEGSRLENKIFPYNKEDFAAMLSPEAIKELSIVFQAQNFKSYKNYKEATR